MPMDRQQQQMALVGHYQQRLGEIPLTAAVPPALNNIVSLAREIETMRNAPSGTYTDAQQETAFYNYVQEGFKLYDQRVDPGTFLRDKYPSNGENIDTYFASLPEVAWNNPGLLLHSGKDFVINTGTALTAGLFVDIPDWIGNKANFGSFKSLLGVDKDASLMETWTTAAKGAIEDNITGKPVIRPGTNDQLVYNGNENVLDIASLFVGGGIVKGGINYGTKAVKYLGETNMGIGSLIKIFARGADDVAPLADDLAGKAAREAAETAAKKQADDLAAATARNSDNPTVIHPAGKPVNQIDFDKFKEEMLTAVATATKQPGFFGRATSRGALMAMTVLPFSAFMGFGAIETQSKGAATSTLVDGVEATLRAGIKAGAITAENLESSVSAATVVHTIYNWVDKSAQNLAVKGALRINGGDGSQPEDIARGKNAALLWLTKPDSIAGIAANMALRASLVDEVIPNKDEADKFLAESFINNIVEKSEVWELGDNQITRDDVKAKLATLLAQDSHLSGFIKGTRLENGLRQVWPDIFPAPQAEENLTAQAPGIVDKFSAAAERLTNLTVWQKKLTEMAESVKDIQYLGWMSPIIAFAAAIIGLIVAFFKPDAAETVQVQTADGGRKLRDVATALGQGDIVLGNVTNHDGKPQDPIVIDGANTPVVERTPRLNAAMVPQ